MRKTSYNKLLLHISLRIAVSAAVIACVGVCSAAVEPGENIVLNGAFEADQASSPPFWNVGKPENVTW